jgi:hypothetical protein
VGNTLAKPSLLLHREKVRETTEDAEVLQEGKGFEADRSKEVVQAQQMISKVQDLAMHHQENIMNQCEMLQDYDYSYPRGEMLHELEYQSDSLKSSNAFFKKSKKSGGLWNSITSVFRKEEKFDGVNWDSKRRFGIRHETDPSSFTIYNNMDYALQTGKVIANLKPNASGEILIDPRQLGSFNILQIVLVDANATVVSNFQVQSGSLQKKDMRVTRPMSPGIIWTESYRIFESENREGLYTVDQKDLSNAQSFVIPDMEALFNAMTTIANKNIDLVSFLKWNFLPSWSKLSLEEKYEKWEKFGGTELISCPCLKRTQSPLKP